MSNEVDGVREVSRSEADRLEVQGRIADLSRDEVIVHVGKPVGSITGLVGPFFWQVWSDVRDEPGTVHARIGQGEARTWRYDPAMPKDAMLAQAKDRLVAEVQAEREAQLQAARARLDALAPA